MSERDLEWFRVHFLAERQGASGFAEGDVVRQVGNDDQIFPRKTLLTVVDPGDRYCMIVRKPDGEFSLVRPRAYEKVTK